MYENKIELRRDLGYLNAYYIHRPCDPASDLAALRVAGLYRPSPYRQYVNAERQRSIGQVDRGKSVVPRSAVGLETNDAFGSERRSFIKTRQGKKQHGEAGRRAQGSGGGRG